MQEQDSVPAGAILENWSKDPWTNGVQVDRMEDMEKLVIQTRNSLYEIIIIDGRSGEILVRRRQLLQNARNIHRLPDGDQRQWPADCDHSRRIHPNSRPTSNVSFQLNYIIDKYSVRGGGYDPLRTDCCCQR